MRKILDIIEALYPFSYSIVGSGNDAAVSVFQSFAAFEVFEYASGMDVNGWVIPKEHIVHTAQILRDGKVVYDGTISPLGVIAQSISFEGTVSLETLLAHCHVDPINTNGVPYHWQQLYGKGPVDWGFCLSQTARDALVPGDYQIVLKTEFVPGTMKVLVATLPGRTSETILLNGHNCHPYQANDDISGCAVAIAALQKLAALPDRRYSYSVMIAPELLGPIFWLNFDRPAGMSLFGAMLFKSVGNDAPLRLQESWNGQAKLDLAAHVAMRAQYGEYQSGPYRTVYGNDEIVFEAPGFEIPCISFTRSPFKQYHSNLDTPDTLSETALQETLSVVLSTISYLERDSFYHTTFKGVPCLSSPRYDLYRPVTDRRLGADAQTALRRRWNLMMNRLPRDLNEGNTALDLAARYELPFEEVSNYIGEWVEKGLLQPTEKHGPQE